MTSGSDLDNMTAAGVLKILSVEHDTYVDYMPSEYATVEVHANEAFDRDQSLVPVSI